MPKILDNSAGNRTHERHAQGSLDDSPGNGAVYNELNQLTNYAEDNAVRFQGEIDQGEIDQGGIVRIAGEPASLTGNGALWNGEIPGWSRRYSIRDADRTLNWNADCE